jgi:DNA-binding NtrC family response regulator
MAQKKILMVEDSLSMVAIYKAYLNDTNYQVRIVTDLNSAYGEIERETPDLILLDVELPDGSGLTLLKKIQAQTNDIEIIVMTAHGSSKMAIQAIDDGAFDFLTKPFDAARLLVTIDNAIKHQNLNHKVATYSSFDVDQYCRFIGKSLPMQAVYKTIDSLAASSATAFIIGESGTGKELAAEAIHQKSQRSGANFHAINCAAIPSELMESELFGHVKGAFTGATSNREGAAAIADGGTLFLDEICEMDLDLQKSYCDLFKLAAIKK